MIDAFFELMRYKNCAMAGLASVIGAAIAYSAISGELAWFDVPNNIQLFLVGLTKMSLIFAAVFLITGAGNAINDYFDAGIDAINRPKRPIPSGRIKKDSAFKFSFVLFAAGILISYLIGSHIPFFIAVFNSSLLYFYAFSLKRRVFAGNLSVSYLSGSTFLFGGAAFGIQGIRFTLVLFFLSMLATLAREIVKSIEDMEGDRKEGAITLPVKMGERNAAYAACAFGLMAVLLSPLPYFMEALNEYYLFVVGIADLFFLYAMGLVLTKNPSASSSYFKMAMFFALLAFIAGSILKNKIL